MHTKWFNFAIVLMTTAMFGLMLLLIIVAFSKRSGSTGQDMAEIHIRQHAPPKLIR